MLPAKTNVLKQDIMEEALPLVHDTICQIAWKFQTKYGDTFEFWLSEGYYIFCNVMRTHTSLSSINTWLYSKLNWGMMDVVRKQCKNSRRMCSYHDLQTYVLVDGEDMEELLPYKHHDNFDVLVGHVSDTARDLWQMILDPPLELVGELDKREPEACEDAIKHYCKHKLHWTLQQVATSFDELFELVEG